MSYLTCQDKNKKIILVIFPNEVSLGAVCRKCFEKIKWIISQAFVIKTHKEINILSIRTESSCIFCKTVCKKSLLQHLKKFHKNLESFPTTESQSVKFFRSKK